MVKKYAELYLDARRALLPTEGQFASNVARELICAASGKTAEQLISDRDLYASEEICELAQSFVRRRVAGEPMPYILGEWDFYGMTLTVTPDVLIPRDDTMAVTELAIKKALFLEQNPRILDLCTGSGCIGLAIARRVKDARCLLYTSASLRDRAFDHGRSLLLLQHGGRDGGQSAHEHELFRQLRPPELQRILPVLRKIRPEL